MVSSQKVNSVKKTKLKIRWAKGYGIVNIADKRNLTIGYICAEGYEWERGDYVKSFFSPTEHWPFDKLPGEHYTSRKSNFTPGEIVRKLKEVAGYTPREINAEIQRWPRKVRAEMESRKKVTFTFNGEPVTLRRYNQLQEERRNEQD